MSVNSLYFLLKERWMALYSFVDNTALVESSFKALVVKYTEHHRHYHTLTHIHACLLQFDDVKDCVSDMFHVETAIWFHDTIYAPSQDNNEEISAQYAQKFLEDIAVNPRDIEKTIRFILCTKHPIKPTGDDEKYLVDIDLSILGKGAIDYEKYEHAIRQEYNAVPNDSYKIGRAAVLNSFLQSDRIYLTDYFYEKYEVNARENISQALAQL